MQSKVFIFLAAAFLALTANAQKTVRESPAPTSPIVIDGLVNEWNIDWLMDNKTSLLYNVANDKDNLYIRMKISNEVAQQKIALFGLTVYLNPEGGKKGRFGLRYPVEKNKDDMKKEQSGEAKEKSWNEMKKDLIRDADLLELLGLDKDPIPSTRVGLLSGLEVIMIVDEYGYLVYEAKIPFKAFRIDKSKVENMGIVIETGRLVQKQSMSGGKPMYYHGVRYSAPMGGQQSYNEFTVATVLHLNYKLN